MLIKFLIWLHILLHICYASFCCTLTTHTVNSGTGSNNRNVVTSPTRSSALSKARGKAFSNMAVGYNNVDVNAANKYVVAVGNTPGVLTETAASLSLAAARR